MSRVIALLFCTVILGGVLSPLRADDADVEKLAKGLKAKKWQDRVKAAQEFGKLGEKGGPAAAKHLCEACADGTKEVREASLEALEKVSPKLYKPVLVLVVDKDGNNHVKAIQELAKLGDEGKPAVPLLYAYVGAVIKGTSVKDNAPAFFPLDVVGGSSYYDALFETLSQLAPDENTAKVIASAANLESGRYRKPDELHRSSMQALRKLAESQDACRRVAVPVFVKALDSPIFSAVEKRLPPFNTHRVLAAEALGACGPAAKDAIPALKKLKLDESEKVRKAATDALEKIDK
jgi:HEAT repeat protein